MGQVLPRMREREHLSKGEPCESDDSLCGLRSDVRRSFGESMKVKIEMKDFHNNLVMSSFIDAPIDEAGIAIFEAGWNERLAKIKFPAIIKVSKVDWIQ